MSVKVINEKEFDDFVAEGVSVVDYWATWCGPCRMVAPVVEQLSDQYEGKIKFGKVDVDDNEQLAVAASVSTIPNICVYKDGALVDRIIGVQPKEAFEALLNKYL